MSFLSLQKSAKFSVDATNIKGFFIHQIRFKQLIKLFPKSMNTSFDSSHFLSLQFSVFLFIHHNIIFAKILRFLIKLHNHLNDMIVSRCCFIGKVSSHTK